MATFLEKLQIFEKDQVKAITASFGTKPKAVKADVQKLRGWIEANKEVKASTEIRAKLFAIIERYHRAHVSLATLHAPLKALLEDLLRLDHHFLDDDGLSKVTGWLSSLQESEDVEIVSHISRWSIEMVDESKGLVSLVNTENPDMWKEDYILPHEYIIQLGKIKDDVERGVSIIVEIDDDTNVVQSVEKQG